MDRIAYLADLSVRKGVSFALLAIATIMLGFSYDLHLCLRSGTILVALVTVVLVLRAVRAPSRNHRSTELWALLRKGADLPAGYPPSIINEVLRKTYVRYAEWSGGLTALLAVLTLVVGLVRS